MRSIALLCLLVCCPSAMAINVVTDFEGGSAKSVEIDQATATISFMPGGDPSRGWPCWWYFRVEGLKVGQSLTLRLRGSTATVDKPGSPLLKPLAAAWAMPKQATYSTDGKAWLHTSAGRRDGQWMVYTLPAETESVYVAWGPPYTPTMAQAKLSEVARLAPHAEVIELCKSREGRAVPMLHILQGDLPREKRFGVWVNARQHAWESGGSWVAQGFAEWVCTDPAADWLRQHAEIFIIPIMDVDNAATGNGGKDADPHDHNRDWTDEPHWNEVIAAKKKVSELIREGRMDVFLDLHNPAPGDPTFFFAVKSEMIHEPMIGERDRFIAIAYGHISKIKPLIPMSNKPKLIASEYHPLWKQISANWVAMNGNPRTVAACLETIWNYENSTTVGYRAVGSNLALSVSEFLHDSPAK